MFCCVLIKTLQLSFYRSEPESSHTVQFGVPLLTNQHAVRNVEDGQRPYVTSGIK